MQLEAWIPSQRIDSIHYAEMNTGKGPDLALLVPVDMEMNGLVDSFVSVLAGAISFWVVHWWHFQFNSSEFIKSLPEIQYEEFVTAGAKIRQ